MRFWTDELLRPEQSTVVAAIRRHACTLLDHTPRFRYFTLHGTRHVNNVFKNVQFLHEAGLRLTSDEAYLLACAICVHDLGMVVPLRDMDTNDILGRPQTTDPANLELEIRNIHSMHRGLVPLERRHSVFRSQADARRQDNRRVAQGLKRWTQT
jgi:hypothetical protein